MNILASLDYFFATYLNTVLFWILAFYLLWNLYIIIFNRGVPNIRTSPRIRKEIIEYIKSLPEKEGLKIVDMGSGNGLFSRELARNIPYAEITGLEIDPKSLWWSKFWNRYDNLSYERADFFKYDVSDVDIVYFYLSAYEMGRMRKKLQSELKPGAIVISNRFQLGGKWGPHKILRIKDNGLLEKFLHPFQGRVNIYLKP